MSAIRTIVLSSLMVIIIATAGCGAPENDVASATPSTVTSTIVETAPLPWRSCDSAPATYDPAAAPCPQPTTTPQLSLGVSVNITAVPECGGVTVEMLNESDQAAATLLAADGEVIKTGLVPAHSLATVRVKGSTHVVTVSDGHATVTSGDLTCGPGNVPVTASEYSSSLIG